MKPGVGLDCLITKNLSGGYCLYTAVLRGVDCQSGRFVFPTRSSDIYAPHLHSVIKKKLYFLLRQLMVKAYSVPLKMATILSQLTCVRIRLLIAQVIKTITAI